MDYWHFPGSSGYWVRSCRIWGSMCAEVEPAPEGYLGWFLTFSQVRKVWGQCQNSILCEYINKTSDWWHHRLQLLVSSFYGGILRGSSPARNIPFLPTQHHSSETDLGDLFQQLGRIPCSQQRCDNHRVKRVWLTSSRVSGHNNASHTTYEFAKTYWEKTL